MARTPRQELDDAIRLVKEAEREVSNAQAYAQSDWSYVWTETGNAQAKLKKIQSILETLLKTI
jgi:multidrug resistance efflux pump